MSRTSSLGTIITMQLVNALLVFAFSVYLGVTAYPLVAFFQEREVTATYVSMWPYLLRWGYLSSSVGRPSGRENCGLGGSPYLVTPSSASLRATTFCLVDGRTVIVWCLRL